MPHFYRYRISQSCLDLSSNGSPTLVRAGLGAGRIIGAFLQQFETLPQPLPELREGSYIVPVVVISGTGVEEVLPQEWSTDRGFLMKKYPKQIKAESCK